MMAWYAKLAMIGGAMIFAGMLVAIESVACGFAMAACGFAMAKTGLVAMAVSAIAWLADQHGNEGWRDE